MESSGNDEKGYDEKADIWSIGITAMELGYGRAPYSRFQPMKVMLMVLQEEPPTCDIYNDPSTKFSKHFHSMIEKCLRRDPSKRPSARRLLEHKFFKQAKDCAYVREQIVQHLAVRPRGQKQDIRTRLSAADAAAHRPVSVTSWVFDDTDLQQLKQASEQSHRLRASELSKAYHDDEDSDVPNSGGIGIPVTHRSTSDVSIERFERQMSSSLGPTNLHIVNADGTEENVAGSSSPQRRFVDEEVLDDVLSPQIVPSRFADLSQDDIVE